MGRSYVYTNRANRSEINVFIFWVRESNTHRSFLAKELYVGIQQMDAQWSHRRPSRRHRELQETQEGLRKRGGKSGSASEEIGLQGDRKRGGASERGKNFKEMET